MFRSRRAFAVLVVFLVTLAPGWAQAPAKPEVEGGPQPAPHVGGRVKGSLSVEKGVRVLRVHGTPREMGFAHGYLLAAEILESFDAYIVHSPVVGGPRNYQARIVPMVRKQMVFLPEHEAELGGMLEGIQAALGEKARVASLDRPIDLLDLKVANTYGDWYMFACSSFSAWGALTPDGETITARNFDFLPSPILEKSQLLIAYGPSDPKHERWVNVSFAGMIGVISGMNEDGVGLFVHDVWKRKGAEHETGVHARLLVLRSAIESTGPANAPETVLGKFRALQTSMSNNVHVTSPFDRKHPPAGIIEYDGVTTQDDGADLRWPVEGACAVYCTNHYRLRAAPSRCGRYSKLTELLGECESRPTKFDAARARSMMSAIVQNSLVSRTLHTVIFFPASKRFDLMLSKDGKVAPASEPVSFTLAELLPPRE
jgi:hypothetical protein